MTKDKIFKELEKLDLPNFLESKREEIESNLEPI